jgi:hypothetical protein
VNRAAKSLRVYRGRRREGSPEVTSVTVHDESVPRAYEIVEVPLTGTAGLDWGYRGGGPANTARAILADLLGEVPEDVDAFADEVVANLDRQGFDLSADEILDWLARRRR